MQTEPNPDMHNATHPGSPRPEPGTDITRKLYGSQERPQASHVSAISCEDPVFAATMGKLAEQQPEVIRNAIRKADASGCTVTLYATDTRGRVFPVELLVDWDDVNYSLLMRGISGEEPQAPTTEAAWQIVLEEAFSWLRVMTMPRGSTAAQCHAALARSCRADELMFALTGQCSPAAAQTSIQAKADPATRSAKPASVRPRATRTLH